MRHEAARHAIVERAQGLLDRRHGVEAVDLVEVHMIEAKALQAGGDLVHDVAARQADRVRPRPHPAAHLGGDDDVLALDAEIAQRLAELNLGLPFGIDVGGVEEIDARFDRAADERRGGLLIERADGPPEPGAAAEGHRAEADFGDILAGAAERSIAHERHSLLKSAATCEREWEFAKEPIQARVAWLRQIAVS